MLEKWRFSYRLFILNEKTLEEVFHIRLSRLTAFVYGGATLIVVFIVMSLLILYSPVKYYLPGFSDYSLRTDLAKNTAKIDSMSLLLEKQTLQLQITKNIIAGTLSVDSIPQQKEINVDKYRELAEKRSENEQQFVDNFQKNILQTTPKITIADNAKNQSFIAPLAGTVAIVSDLKSDDNTLIITSNSNKAISITSGMVLFTELTLKNRYVAIIQHPNGFVSVYKNLSSAAVNSGDPVTRGHIVGSIDLAGKEPYLIFELWHNNISIDPYEVFDF